MKYYAYRRVSTQSQVEDNGTQMQEDVIDKFCKEKGIEITETFEDLGISGTVVDRDGITELLAILEDGDRIIVQNTSRLWRDDVAKVMIRREIQKAGADVISIEQPTYSVNTKDPNDFLINGMMELLDQYDKMNISMKLFKGRKAKAKKGSKPCGTAPYGYKWQDGEIVVDYNNNCVVQIMFKEYMERKSLSAVKNYLDQEDYRTINGKLFSKQSIANILSNDFYTGIVTFGGKKSKGTHQALISEDLFNKVQEILKR